MTEASSKKDMIEQITYLMLGLKKKQLLKLHSIVKLLKSGAIDRTFKMLEGKKAMLDKLPPDTTLSELKIANYIDEYNIRMCDKGHTHTDLGKMYESTCTPLENSEFE